VHLISDHLERRAYHTNMDTFDRLVEEDIVQSAIVMASLAYQAAMHEAKMPRTLPSSERRRQR
jgi:carboxypeptidase Q